ncbi:MAG TPA: NYN domain-containing protein [Syntrophorhabdus sp.]|jgi:predicted RNA-binding protein with PIN domain|nr:NYN domain-containing protein [Syntrophorhabdus sp.]
MLHLIIDGYNYIHRIRSGPIDRSSNLDMLRRELLEKLFRYKRDRSVRITVVFDARGGYNLGRQRESYKGINVVYAGEGETADDVIIGWIRERRSGQIIATSDRAIIDEAKKAGVPFMTPVAMEQSMKSGKEELDEKDDDSGFRRPKTGNPRKLPKKLRKATKSINKIRF